MVSAKRDNEKYQMNIYAVVNEALYDLRNNTLKFRLASPP